VTSRGTRQQKLIALALAIRQAEHSAATWSHQQLRARAARISDELTAATRSAVGPADRQVDDREAEP
jgi:hypothetical protein